jgi:hypothetical protein
MSDRFMMTGVPSRDASPILRASLYDRGCTVVIRRSSGSGAGAGAGTSAWLPFARMGVTWASYSCGTTVSSSWYSSV